MSRSTMPRRADQCQSICIAVAYRIGVEHAPRGKRGSNTSLSAQAHPAPTPTHHHLSGSQARYQRPFGSRKRSSLHPWREPASGRYAKVYIVQRIFWLAIAAAEG
jgi:hypothetical protein